MSKGVRPCVGHPLAVSDPVNNKKRDAIKEEVTGEHRP
jgi:hypothetical protein